MKRLMLLIVVATAAFGGVVSAGEPGGNAAQGVNQAINAMRSIGSPRASSPKMRCQACNGSGFTPSRMRCSSCGGAGER